MTNFGQNLVGRTVYSGGSYAPTRGQVSAQGAQGYLRRTLRQRGNQGTYGGVSKFGADGQSDTRSGMAQQAANRVKPLKPGQTPGINPHPGGQHEPAGPGNNVNRPPRAAGPAAPAPAPQVPTVVVNDAGQLELPYSPAWSEEVLAGLQDSNDALAALQKEQQEQALQYAQDKRNAEQNYDVTKRDTLNDNASRGVAFSSGYGVAVGKNANDFNNLNNSLDLANSQANAGFDFDRTSIINAFKDQLRQAGLDYANSLTADAGELGYGHGSRHAKVKRRPRGNGGSSGGSGNGSGGGGHKGKDRGKK